MSLEKLTPRELSVVALRADYYLGKEIAQRLGTSTRAVFVHLYNARKKFGARSVGELLRRARLQLGQG